MNQRLEGKVAIITGAAHGQGAATARLFAAEGARVVLADIDGGAEALAEEIGEYGMFIKLDVAREGDWQAAVLNTRDRWGEIDILVNNAGIVHVSSLLDLERSDFQKMLDINLIGAWLGIKSVAPSMIGQGGGSIINIASTSALVALNGLAGYVASKWALRGLGKTAALELGCQGVRVNTIYPGGVDTRIGNAGGASKAQINEMYTDQPIARIGDPGEIARASLFLASDDASYLCGADIVVDGGMTLGGYKSFLPGAPSGPKR